MTSRGRKRAAETGITLSAQGIRTEKETYGAYAVVMMVFSHLCIVFGLFNMLTDIFSLRYRIPDILLFTSALCATIWWRYLAGKAAAPKIRTVWLLIGMLFLPYWENLWIQCGQVYRAFQSGAPRISAFDMTEILMILSALLSLFSFYMVFVLKKGWIFYLITIPAVLIGPYIGFTANVIEIFLFACFHIGNSVLSKICGHANIKGKSARRISNLQAKIAGSSIALLSLTVLLLFSGAYFATRNHMGTLLRLPVEMEQQVVQAATGLFHQQKNHNGQINSGNNYPSREKQLEITLPKKPQKDIYLKNFTGSDYLGNRWKPMDEASFYESIRKSANQTYQGYPSQQYFEERQFYYVMYSNYYREARKKGHTELPVNQFYNLEGGQSGTELLVHRLNPGLVGYFVPYISGFQGMNGDSARFSFYTQQELESALKEFNAGTRYYLWLERPYRDYVKKAYLAVPKNRVPRLAALVAQTPQHGVQRITDQIRKTLYSRAYYTLTPGVTPFWEDATEHFLFESHRGYCQQFASTAVLMYRLYGIPARYVAGYTAPASSFKKQKNGTFRATLTDKQAHAWVEVYKENIGWVPVEVTPPASGNKPLLADESRPGTDQPLRTRTEGNIISYEMALSIGIVLAAFVVLLCLRRKWLLKQRYTYTADYLFERLIEVLHLGNFMKEFSGVEDGFPSALIQAVPRITEEEADRLLKLVYREVFGKNRISQEETEEVRRIYLKVCDAVYRTLNPYKKCYFRFWKVYQ